MAERTLCFKYSSDDQDLYAKELVKELDKAEFNYVAYDDYNYWLFKIQKPKNWTWDEVMHLVNSIHSAKYWFTKTAIVDGVEYDLR